MIDDEHVYYFGRTCAANVLARWNGGIRPGAAQIERLAINAAYGKPEVRAALDAALAARKNVEAIA